MLYYNKAAASCTKRNRVHFATCCLGLKQQTVMDKKHVSHISLKMCSDIRDGDKYLQTALEMRVKKILGAKYQAPPRCSRGFRSSGVLRSAELS